MRVFVLSEGRLSEKLQAYAKTYKEPPYRREIEGTVELLEEAANNLEKYANFFSKKLKEYEKTPKEERIKQYREECCRACRYNDCECTISGDILKPVPSDVAFIPGRKTCGKFRWR